MTRLFYMLAHLIIFLCALWVTLIVFPLLLLGQAGWQATAYLFFCRGDDECQDRDHPQNIDVRA